MLATAIVVLCCGNQAWPLAATTTGHSCYHMPPAASVSSVYYSQFNNNFNSFYTTLLPAVSDLYLTLWLVDFKVKFVMATGGNLGNALKIMYFICFLKFK